MEGAIGPMILDTIKFDENGLVPAVLQDAKTGQVLMVAYMNREALEKTISSGKAVFYSRSRQKLWLKGETSGHYMNVESLRADCDMDCLLLKVTPEGPACHTGKTSCFYRELSADKFVENEECDNKAVVLQEVYETISDRKKNKKEGSYTNYLFEKGLDKILKKIGEEATEVIIGAKNAGTDEACYEIGDLLYHLMVLMVEKGMSWDDVFRELEKRQSVDKGSKEKRS